MKLYSRILLGSMVICGLSAAVAEESTAGKMEDTKNKTVDSAKSHYRSAKDKACEMVDGKMQCAGKKMMHKAENGVDKVSTETKSLKNKTENKTE